VLTTSPPSSADCLEIWEPQPPGTLRVCNGIALPFTQRQIADRVAEKQIVKTSDLPSVKCFFIIVIKFWSARPSHVVLSLIFPKAPVKINNQSAKIGLISSQRPPERVTKL
jgi:hypothetical protein